MDISRVWRYGEDVVHIGLIVRQAEQFARGKRGVMVTDQSIQPG
jgi:hypothetical protein